jgi:phage shock protein PspC (stress-responsive transcriptional regulator)
MEKVTTINLGGRAYQVEERGFEALQAYLAEAKERLALDPSKDEIIADLEQAIAEKCDAQRTSHKTVVTQDEIEKIIEQMGSVESDNAAPHHDAPRTPHGKRLYLILDGAMIAGVCTGLATYFDIDITLVRILFVILTLFSGGAVVLLYIALAVLIPYADTAEALAQAHGEVLNAQVLVDRAKKRFEDSYERVTGHASQWQGKEWKREQKMQWKRERRAHRHARSMLGMLLGGLGLMWILALMSLVATHAIFGWPLPPGIPLWVAIIGLFVLYHAVTGPIKAARYAPHPSEYQYHYSAWDSIEAGLTVFFLAVFFIWAYANVPEISFFLHHPISETKQILGDISRWWQRTHLR